MHYDPIKKTLGRFFSGPLFMGKIFYFLLDMLLLRTWHVKKALRKIARELPEDASVLDAGAGFGQYTWRMSRMNRKWKIKAVDIDQEHVTGCNKFFNTAGLSGRIACELLDLTELKEMNSFDFILSVDVMEHIREDGLVFSNFCHALKPEGSLLISTPSDQGGSDVYSAEEHSFIHEHVRNGYGISEISQKLEHAGFKNIKASYTYGVPGNISWHLSMKYPVEMLNYSKLFYLFLPFYYLIFFPVALFLNFLDVSLIHKSGTGLLVLASK
jgi:2-polyprenyl-3-methyl-5-hydroxy-6-metoxy-1,4-benzoquinol methylase